MKDTTIVFIKTISFYEKNRYHVVEIDRSLYISLIAKSDDALLTKSMKAIIDLNILLHGRVIATIRNPKNPNKNEPQLQPPNITSRLQEQCFRKGNSKKSNLKSHAIAWWKSHFASIGRDHRHPPIDREWQNE
jgi:hypothetical protein